MTKAAASRPHDPQHTASPPTSSTTLFTTAQQTCPAPTGAQPRPRYPTPRSHSCWRSQKRRNCTLARRPPPRGRGDCRSPRHVRTRRRDRGPSVRPRIGGAHDDSPVRHLTPGDDEPPSPPTWPSMISVPMGDMLTPITSLFYSCMSCWTPSMTPRVSPSSRLGNWFGRPIWNTCASSNERGARSSHTQVPAGVRAWRRRLEFPVRSYHER